MATTTDYANLSEDVYNTVPNGTPADIIGSWVGLEVH